MRNISRAEFIHTAAYALVGLGLYGCGQKAEEATAPSTDTVGEGEATSEADESEETAEPEPEPGIWVVCKERQIYTYAGEERENVTKEYELDAYGNLLSIPMVESDSGFTSGVEYTYDENGWRTAFTSVMPNPEGGEPSRSVTELQNEYDESGRLVSLSWEELYMGEAATSTNSYTYNALGYVSDIEMASSSGTRRYLYDEDGFRTELSYEPAPDGEGEAYVITYDYEWDGSGHLARCTASYDSGYTIVNTYACDENGNVISRESKSVNAEGVESAGATSYEYEYMYVENPSMGARVYRQLALSDMTMQ